MADVAKVAGVSTKTVSNYFSGYPYMRVETRQRIEAAIAQLDYTLNISASNLRSGRSGLIGLAIPELATPYFAGLAQLASVVGREYGLAVVLCLTEGGFEQESRLLAWSRERIVEALIVVPVALAPCEIEEMNYSVPLAVVGQPGNEAQFKILMRDKQIAGSRATSYLLELCSRWALFARREGEGHCERLPA